MTPAAIIRDAAADRVVISRSAAGTLKSTGEHVAVTRWVPVIRENKPGILSALEKTEAGPPIPDSAAAAERVAQVTDFRVTSEISGSTFQCSATTYRILGAEQVWSRLFRQGFRA